MLSFTSNNPSSLLNAFDAAIAKGTGTGSIITWRKVDGYYTHTSTQWGGEAYFKASVAVGQLRFNIIRPNNKNITVTAYGYYHGHLIETFLNHFDKSFSAVSATPTCVSGDVCQAA